jgi:hypothetical protein
LILLADIKPLRSATRSAGIAVTRDRSDSATSASVILETENDLIVDNRDDYSIRQTALITNDVNYDTDIEQEKDCFLPKRMSIQMKEKGIVMKEHHVLFYFNVFS